MTPSMTPGLVYVTRKFTFSAAHRYWQPRWSAEENARAFGSLTVTHGHNYVLEVTLAGPVDPDHRHGDGPRRAQARWWATP